MAIRVANLTKTFDFIWDQDPDKDDPKKATVFELGYLDAYDHAYINDRMTSFDGEVTSTGTTEAEIEMAIMTQLSQRRVETYKAAVLTARLAIRGVRNIQDDEGKQVELQMVDDFVAGRKRLVADDNFIRSLDPTLCLAIFNKVQKANTITVDQAKNLKPE